MTAFAAPETEFDSSVLRDINERGWSVLTIPEDAEGPPFAFTLGLWAHAHHPELLMVGQHTENMQGDLNAACRAISAGRPHFEAGQSITGLRTGPTGQFLTVPPSAYRDYLGYALWLYGNQEFPVLQCVWADPHGRYPWHAEAPDLLRQQQPVLGLID